MSYTLTFLNISLCNIFGFYQVPGVLQPLQLLQLFLDAEAGQTLTPSGPLADFRSHCTSPAT